MVHTHLVNVRGGVEQAEDVDEPGEARQEAGVHEGPGGAGAGVLRLFRPGVGLVWFGVED